MEKFLLKIEKSIDWFLDKEVGVLTWILGFFGIITSRLFIDDFVAKSGSFNLFSANSVHNYLFFLINLLFLLLLLSFFLKIRPFRLSNLFFWLIFGFIFPPILDMIKTGGALFNSSYLVSNIGDLWLQYATFFGNLPSGVVYFGTRILAFVFVVTCFGLLYVKSKNLGKSLLGTLLAYTGLFFMASFPSWLTAGYYLLAGTKEIFEISVIDIVQFSFSPNSLFGLSRDGDLISNLVANLNLVYYLLALLLLIALFFYGAREKFLAVIKNSRPPQLAYHSGLFLTGLGLGYLAYPENWSFGFFPVLALIVMSVSIWLAWIASVIVNDIYDYEIDAISNSDRPLQKKIFSSKEYKDLGTMIFVSSLFGGLVVSLKFATFLLVYQFIAWIYSAKPFRLKKFAGIATFASAAASSIILFMGFTLLSGNNNIQGLSWRIILLLLISLTLSLPIKDFKDIEGDKKYQIWTIPVIFGEEKGRLIVAVGIFTSFMLSVFLLNEFRLFWWALLFGGISFLIVINKKPRQLFWWVLGVVSVYGMILVKTLFL